METREEVKPTAADIAKKLNEMEKTSGSSGAVPLQPKHLLLDASDVQQRHPDKRLRWLNLKNPDKIATRTMQGYTMLSSEEGGRSLGGEMALFSVPRKIYDERVAAQKRLTQDRLVQHNREFENIAENLSRFLRDNHGIKISTEQLLAKGE